MASDRRRLTRRAVMGAAAAALAAGPARAAVSGEHPALLYMRQVGKDLLAAHRQGTVASFLRALQRHADVPGIALYSLGSYQTNLPEAQREPYYRGVALFMARYFADQSREYPVAKYELGEAEADAADTLVRSRVYLMSGATYNVTWRLERKGKGYKVTDVKVLGFSLVYLQRGLFQSYLSKRSGDVNALILALNR